MRLILSLVGLGIVSTLLASLAEQLGELALSWFWPEGTLAYDLIQVPGAEPLRQWLLQGFFKSTDLIAHGC